MTREEAINKWVMPAIKNTWNEKKCGEIIEALEQQPCEDAISRKSIMERLNNAKMFFEYEGADTFDKGRKNGLIDAIDIVADEPSVYPKPKTGHWIMIDKELQRYKCSECGEIIKLYKKSEIPKLEKDETLSNYPFSHCGCRMVESQENEE